MKTKNKNINLIKIICWIASILSFGYAIIILVSIISFTPISAQMDTPTTDTEYIRDDMRIYFETTTQMQSIIEETICLGLGTAFLVKALEKRASPIITAPPKRVAFSIHDDTDAQDKSLARDKAVPLQLRDSAGGEALASTATTPNSRDAKSHPKNARTHRQSKTLRCAQPLTAQQLPSTILASSRSFHVRLEVSKNRSALNEKPYH